MKINKNTEVTGEISGTVQKAVNNLKRDMAKVFLDSDAEGGEILLARSAQENECYCLQVSGNRMCLMASDELGFIYGIYEISRSLFGVPDFWFWNDWQPEQLSELEVPESFRIQSKPFAVVLRGWFINDEVLLHTWSVNRRKEEPWEMVFEALLRCGGNLVIPGTDKNSVLYRSMASKMGLFITHHHAEPLGAEMFARAYPGLTPSYAEYPDKYLHLWKEGIRQQRGMKVIWNLGFRGQGDCPFWEDDPAYATNQARGELVSKLIKIQYDLVKASDPEAVCCTNLYGETMELYNGGYLDIPEDVIKIWADNGYGKMVTRRQGNHNPRIPALPKEKKGNHGIYYHVSFYDLQAANHITMLANSPEFVKSQLEDVLRRSMDAYWIINCSNVKPHVYFLDFIAAVWRDGDVDIDAHRKQYVSCYYGEENHDFVAGTLKAYPKYALSYGQNEDDHAGEQFSNHVMRVLVSQYMKNREMPAEDIFWASNKETLRDQVSDYKRLCEQAAEGYEEYLSLCEQADSHLFGEARELYRDSLLLQVQIHHDCYKGACYGCEGLQKAFDGELQQAFYEAGKAREWYLKADKALRDREHGKWHDFYKNECLTDIKQTAWVLKGLMSYLRNLGDGPHFYQWQREFLYSEEDRRVMLILNMENHLTDQEIFELMEEKWG